MSGIEVIAAVGTPGVDATALLGAAPLSSPSANVAATPGSFADLLLTGVQQVDRRVSSANELVRRFAIDDSVPLHQVTYALEEARLSVELAMQVQTRLIEGYRQLMNMQL